MLKCDEFVVTVIEIIREIKVEGNNEIEVNATQAYQFNIKDPIITTDSTNIAIIIIEYTYPKTSISSISYLVLVFSFQKCFYYYNTQSS
jgi:hypothetical protein